MPRRPRGFVEGGIYHVYNRFARGEAVFADPEEALEFVEFLRFVKKRDGWTVFAWSLLSNHYQLAIRSRAVPISHGLHYLQGRFSQRFNRSRKRTGALWQSRYQAKPINEQAYLAAMRLGCRDAGRIPDGEPATKRIWLRQDRDLAPDDSGPYIDVLGRSTGPERPEVSAWEFVDACAAVLDIEVDELASRSRQRNVVEARRLIVTLGRERWGQSTKELASVLEKSADTVSFLTREGIKHRLENEAFAQRYQALDADMIARGQPTAGEAYDR